ncbi:hypothetical protein WJU23_21430 [Prosthecobacter sp. SYSU 5D2]|uniref:hypothetical protein n=1 Tax=Prosthecobacter sp. SYSU 5D2 TaxID=3134134 RepID=UPI0031FE91B7
MAKSSLPSVDQLTRALEITRQIEKLESELASILGGDFKAVKKLAKSEKVTPTGRKKRTMSPEAKEKIAAAQRLRWSKQKKADKKA